MAGRRRGEIPRPTALTAVKAGGLTGAQIYIYLFMKIWKLNLYHNIFPYVASGKKTIEGRAWSEKRDYRKMKRGDKIVFSDLGSKKTATVIVCSVKHYKTVKAYLEGEGLKKCLPWAESLAEGIGIYYGIAEDWEGRIRTRGIFAIRIQLEKKF